jgi:hypothetical protein
MAHTTLTMENLRPLIAIAVAVLQRCPCCAAADSELFQDEYGQTSSQGHHHPPKAGPEPPASRRDRATRACTFTRCAAAIGASTVQRIFRARCRQTEGRASMIPT